VPVVVVGVTPHQGERESRLQGQVAQVSTIIRRGKVRVMQRAEALMEIIHERGKRGLPLERLYRHLFNPELYLRAYGKIYRNDGSMTPGSNEETVDGMSLKKIQAIVDALRYECYRWTPVRRVYIDKKGSPGKRRPLGLPSWSDKLLQEVIRSLLEAYYEPQFSEHSHGFGPGQGLSYCSGGDLGIVAWDNVVRRGRHLPVFRPIGSLACAIHPGRGYPRQPFLAVDRRTAPGWISGRLALP
jgi:hypothetical protein